MCFRTLLFFAPVFSLASLTIQGPDDVILPSEWASDNAIVEDYNVPFLSAPPSDGE